jgi:hypothetical protein
MALLTSQEATQPTPIIKEKVEAKIKQKQAKEAEKRAGRFLAMMLDDLRDKLRTRRERQIIREEEQRLRVQNKWARIIWRQGFWQR